MRDDVLNIKNEAIAQIIEAKSASEIELVRINYLGRKGRLNEITKKFINLSKDEKKEIGRLLNDVKNTITNQLNSHKNSLNVIKKEWFDLTVPGEKQEIGHLHPQTIILSEILELFNYLGFQVADGPDIENDRYNFEILNFPKDHPARDAQQTMYFDISGTKAKFGEWIPRTHTSAMQGRIMEKTNPPFRVVVPGRCFRYEQVDASHGVEFWQVEGFAVDKNVKFTDLLGTIEYILKGLFGKDTKIRYANTFFPFVEPGLDAYLECTVCKGKGCPFCKNTGWSEIMPAGMIHPNVFKNSGINPKKWNGFAFAIGLSRVVTLRYKINDLRVLHTPDLRIINQF